MRCCVLRCCRIVARPYKRCEKECPLNSLGNCACSRSLRPCHDRHPGDRDVALRGLQKAESRRDPLSARVCIACQVEKLLSKRFPAAKPSKAETRGEPASFRSLAVGNSEAARCSLRGGASTSRRRQLCRTQRSRSKASAKARFPHRFDLPCKMGACSSFRFGARAAEATTRRRLLRKTILKSPRKRRSTPGGLVRLKKPRSSWPSARFCCTATSGPGAERRAPQRMAATFGGFLELSTARLWRRTQAFNFRADRS